MTIKDLAKRSGYSLGTVSRVLNGHPNVSEKARAAVMKVVEEQGFERNSNAKNLKRSQSDGVLVVVKGRGNLLFSAMVEQYQEIFAQTDHQLIIDYMDELEDEVHRATVLCRERKPRGVLFLGGSYRNFQEGFSAISVPAVLVTNTAAGLEFENLSSVSTDDCKGAACAVEHLLQTGHRDILVLGGDRSPSDTSCERYSGCVEAFRHNGLTFPEECYRTCRFSYQSGYAAMKKALEAGSECTAVFAMADVIAIGAIRAIRDHGLRVPQDVSVIGYDGLELGDYLEPKLATVVQPVEEMARRSAAMLLEQIAHGARSSHVTVPFALTVKDSVGHVPKKAEKRTGNHLKKGG